MLDADGVAEWQRLAGVFKTQPTRFQEGDRAAVAAYCAYWAAFRRAAREVAGRGPVVEGRTAADRSRLVKNPATVAMRECATQLRYFARELGLTPDARGRMGLNDDDREIDADNPFAWPAGRDVSQDARLFAPEPPAGG
jgi:P27 family predicted phage terminase small subunit